MTQLVRIRDLRVDFDGVPALHGVDLDIAPGEALGLVGESGCGKSITWLAALGLLPRTAVIGGSVQLDKLELRNASRTVIEKIRGGRVAMIFQDPSSALNPVIRVGRQIAEALWLHRGLAGEAARQETVRLMELVGIPDAARRIRHYPHEFSGGQCQRLMIAMALAGNPDLLIADEPTTALDATIQAQILTLLTRLRRETGMAIVFISHDLGAVAQVCDRICVMYAGRIIETGSVSQVFERPQHPYTKGLLDAIPRLDCPPGRLVPIPGTVPEPGNLPKGCSFSPRCAYAQPQCTHTRPRLTERLGGSVACAFPLHESIEDNQVEGNPA